MFTNSQCKLCVVLTLLIAISGCGEIHQQSVDQVSKKDFEQNKEQKKEQEAAIRKQQLLKRKKQRELIQIHLLTADRMSQKALVNRLRMIDTFFKQVEKGIVPFSREMFSLNSKWLLLTDHVPFAGDQRHQRFVRQTFETHLFSSSQVQKLLEQIVAAYLRDLANIESKMLVELRCDLETLEREFPDLGHGSIKLDRELDTMLLQAERATYSSLRTDVVNVVVASVLTKMMARMASSMTIIGVGGASATVTAGVGLVVAVIIDQVVSVVYDWWANPVGNLAQDICRHVRSVKRLIVLGNGSQHGGGLRQELQEIHKSRAVLRSRLLK